MNDNPDSRHFGDNWPDCQSDLVRRELRREPPTNLRPWGWAIVAVAMITGAIAGVIRGVLS